MDTFKIGQILTHKFGIEIIVTSVIRNRIGNSYQGRYFNRVAGRFEYISFNPAEVVELEPQFLAN